VRRSAWCVAGVSKGGVMRRSRLALVFAIVSVVVVAVLPHLGWAGPQSRSRQAVTSIAGGAVTNVRAVTSDPTSGEAFTHSTVFTPLLGAFTRIDVPRGHKAFLDIRFSGTNWCQSSSVPTANCQIVILVNGTETNPLAAPNAVFASTNPSPENDEARAIERVSRVLGGGGYTVSVRWRVTSPSVDFRMFFWALVVDEVRIS